VLTVCLATILKRHGFTALIRLITSLSLGATLRRLRRARDGVTAVEFALAFPIVLTAIMGIIEISMILFVSSLLEGGLRDASRFGITGAQPESGTREQAIVDIVNSRSLGLFHLTTANVKMRSYDSFAQVGQPEPIVTDVNGNHQCDAGDTYTDVNGNNQWDADMAKSGAGGSSSIVVYEVTVDWSLFTTFLAPFLGEDGKMPVGASITVRNEPYAPVQSVSAPPQRTC
jgi:Flp pilus assembly protein TadG